MKHNFKRFLSLLLALVMVLGMFPMGHAHAEETTVRSLQKVTSVEAGEEYVITFAGTSRAVAGVVRNWSAKGDGLDSGNLSSLVAIPESLYVWTMEAADGGFKIRSNTGTYVHIWGDNASLVSSDEADIFTFTEMAGGIVVRVKDGDQRFNNLGGTNKVGGYHDDGTKFDLYKVTEVADPYGKLRGLWSTYHVDTETDTTGKEGQFWKAFDNNPGTHWHSDWKNSTDKLNGSNTFAGIIDLGATYNLNWFSYIPRQDNSNSGQVTQASLYVSAVENPDKDNAEHWTLAAESVSFADDASEKVINFTTQPVRYVKFVAEKSDDGWVAASEFNVGYNASTECEHNYVGEVTKEATCVDGQMTYTCSKCNDSYIEPITATAPHTAQPVPGTAPTLDSTGLTDGSVCSVCGTTITAQQTIPATYNDGIIPWTALNVEVGEYQAGYEDLYHEGGAQFIQDDDFGSLWHTYYNDGVRENHWIEFELTENYDVTALRYKPRQGNRNGIITKYEILLSHDGVNYFSAKTGEWTADNTNWKVAEFDAHNAKFVRLVSVESVSTEEGKIFTSAAEIRLVGTPANHNHEFTTTTVDATCATAGSTTITCECGDTHTFEIPATGVHTPAEATRENEKAATCTEPGSYDEVVYCSVCKTHEISREPKTIEPLNHLDENKDNTCDREGCGATICAHTNTEKIPGKAATCTETGLTEGLKCTDCGTVLTEQDEIPVLEHNWDAGVYTDPTTEKDGYTTYTCTVCGETKVVVDEGSILVDPFNKANWKKVSVDSETRKENDSAAEGEFTQAWDGDTITRWHSNWRGSDGAEGKLKAHGEGNAFESISGAIDFGAEALINRFSFLPRQDNTNWDNGDGVVTKASLYKGTLNEDGTYTWEPLAEHVEFEHNQQWKTFTFPEQNVRYIKFVAERSVYNGWVVVSEFDIGREEDHSYTAETITAATCGTDGLVRYTCTNSTEGSECICHHSYTETIPATNEHAWDNACDTDCNNNCGTTREITHQWDNGVEKTPATCTEDGVMTLTCTVEGCGETMEQPILSEGHNYGDLIEAQAEVHKQNELKAPVAAHYHCAACDTYFDADKKETTLAALTGETPEHDENVTKTENVVDPTLDAAGSHDVVTYCSVCNKEMSRTNEVDPPIASKIVKWYNWDGTVLYELKVAADAEVVAGQYDGEPPMRAEDESFTYEFKGWVAVEDGFKAEYTATAKEPAVEADKVVMVSKNVELKSEIQMVYTVKIPASLIDSGAYVVMAKTGAYGEVTKTYTADELVAGENKVYMGVAPAEITAPISITVYDVNGVAQDLYNKDGVKLDDASRTVAGYAVELLKDENKKDLAVALLTYGGYAQEYFGVDAENPAFNLLDEVPDLSNITAETLAAYKNTQTNANMGVKATTVATYVDSNIRIRVYLAVEGDINGYTFTLKTPTGDKEVKAGYDQASKRYYVDITEIASAYIDFEYQITITGDNGTNVITASVLAYARSVLSKSTDEKLLNLAKALYLYNQAANAYYGV